MHPTTTTVQVQANTMPTPSTLLKVALPRMIATTHIALATASATSAVSEVFSTVKHTVSRRAVLIIVIVSSVFVVVSTIGLLLLTNRSKFARSYSGSGSGDNNTTNTTTNSNNITYNTVVQEVAEVKDVPSIAEVAEVQDVERGIKRKREEESDERVLESEERVMRGEVLVTVRVERLAREEVERKDRRGVVHAFVNRMDAEEGYVHTLKPEEVEFVRQRAARLHFSAKLVRGMYQQSASEEGAVQK